MNVTYEMVMRKIECPTCGAKKGFSCMKNGKARSRNHHERQVLAQKFFTAEKILGKQPRKPKPVHKRTKSKSDFYQSWEWKQARYEALKIHGRRCQCCGWQPGDTLGGRLVVDHIKPRSKFPDLELEVANLQVLCSDCNMGKSNVHLDDFRDLDHWLLRISQDG